MRACSRRTHETRCALLGERNKRNSRNTGPRRLRNRNLMKTAKRAKISGIVKGNHLSMGFILSKANSSGTKSRVSVTMPNHAVKLCASSKIAAKENTRPVAQKYAIATRSPLT